MFSYKSQFEESFLIFKQCMKTNKLRIRVFQSKICIIRLKKSTLLYAMYSKIKSCLSFFWLHGSLFFILILYTLACRGSCTPVQHDYAQMSTL